MRQIHVVYQSNEPRDQIPRIIQVAPLCVPRPPAVPDLINGQLASIWISTRLQRLDFQWLELLQLFDDGDFQNYHFQLEATLVSMKRVVDDLVMASYCILKGEEVELSRKIEVDGWGQLFRKGKPTVIGQEVINEFIGEYDSFPVVLNELVNALKHSYLMAEARTQWNNNFPLVFAITAPRNDYSDEVSVHDHDMAELVLGFNKFVKQVMIKMHPKSVGPVLDLQFHFLGSAS